MNADPVQLSIDQLIGAWRLMCSGSTRRSAAREDNVEMVFSGVPVPFFNMGLVTGQDLSAEALGDTARLACAWAAPRAVPWLFVVTHERMAAGVDAAAVLEAYGLLPLMPLTGMLAERVSPSAQVPDGLHLTVPKDDEGCEALVRINAKAYGMDFSASSDLIGRQSFWASHYPVVGLNSGAPIACAAVMMVKGLRYVALVATDPDMQRRGYADAAMRRALMNAAAAHGEQPTVLHSTEAGRPVYERMGYAAISRHTIFIEKQYMAAP